jgi:hypothetical protein
VAEPLAPELGGPPQVTVGVAPNTAMAAGCLLARVGARYRRMGWLADAEACAEVARRLAAALERGGWPDAASAVAAAGRDEGGGADGG